MILPLFSLLLVSITVTLACSFFGPVMINPLDFPLALFNPGSIDETSRNIIIDHRLPRVILAFLAGGGLAVAGAVFQALLRNPLATPHTLGISAGGALGSAFGILVGLAAWNLPLITPIQIFSLAGSFAVAVIIYTLAQEQGRFSTMRLLLAGVTIALICSAIILFIRYLVDPNKLVMLDRWLMGGIDIMGYDELISILPLYIPAAAILVMESNRLNQLVFGEELAAGRGINVRALQIRVFIAGAVLVSSTVSVVGPIGFIGLIVPHTLRLLFGADHRILLPVSLATGGAFLAVADTIARTAFYPSELPVGVLTAMLGGPFFIYLLIRKKYSL